MAEFESGQKRVNKRKKTTENDMSFFLYGKNNMSFRQRSNCCSGKTTCFCYFEQNDMSYGVIFGSVVWKKRHIVLCGFQNMSFDPLKGCCCKAMDSQRLFQTTCRFLKKYLMSFLENDISFLDFSKNHKWAFLKYF